MTTGASGPDVEGDGQYIPTSRRPSPTFTAAEHQIANARMMLLHKNGARDYLISDPQVLIDLAISDLSDNDMLDAWLTGFKESEAHSAIETFKKHSDSYQKAEFSTFNPMTQEFLRSYGYQQPHDHLDWWNPGDWGQIANKKMGKPVDDIAATILTSPFWLTAQTTQTISDSIKMGWQGVLSAERFSSRMFRTMVDNAKDKDATQLHMFNVFNFQEYWDNSEHHGASFTTESKTKAYDVLNNDEHFNILISISRYGSPKEGIYEHFLGRNGGNTAEALASQVEFLSSDVVTSSEWMAAQEYLHEGNINAGQYAMNGWEDMVYDVPTYFGGLRGQPEAPLTDASGFWTGGHVVAGITAEMFGSILFDPLNVVDVWANTRRLGKVHAGVTSGTGLGWAETVRQHHQAAASLLAYDEAVALKNADMPITTAGRKSAMTNNMLLDANVGIKKNFKEWAENAASGDEHDWLNKISPSTRMNLRAVNENVEYINEAFRLRNEWAREALEAASKGEAFFQPDPALRMLAARGPVWRDAYPLFKQYHMESQWGPFGGTAGIDDGPPRLVRQVRADGTFEDVVPDPRFDFDPDDYDPITGAELLTSRPGLDSYDGVWDFYASYGGAEAIGARLLGGYTPQKLFLPRLGYAAKARLRAVALKNSLLRRGDKFDSMADAVRNEVPSMWAEITNTWVSTQADIAAKTIFDDIREFTKAPEAYPQFAGLSDAALRLSEYDIHRLLADPKHQTDKLMQGGHAAYGGITLQDIVILHRISAAQAETTVKNLEGIYRWVTEEKKSLDDLPDELRLSDEIMEKLKANWPDLSSALVYWDQLPGPGGQHNPAFARQGINYVHNRRLGYLHPPGSTEALLLEKFPEQIVRTGEKTWDELLTDHSYDVGPFRTNLQKAGFTTPNELLTAITEFSIKEVADLAGMSAADLKWFLKHRIHTAVVENKFYDSLGKIKDAAVVAAYELAATPFRIHESLFTHVPQGGYLDVVGNNINAAKPIREFDAFIKMGLRSGMPRKTIDVYLSRFVNSSEAMRWDIVTDVVTEWMGRSGFIRYGGKDAKLMWDNFVRGSEMIYGNTGADQFLSRGRLMPRSISPAVAHEGMTSQANIIPDWRQIGAMTQYMSYMRHLGYRVGLAQLDRLFQKVWVPATLFKFGLAPRNALDEALIAVLNNGPTFYIDSKLSNAAMNRQKIWDQYGNRIIQDKGARIGGPSIESTDLIAVSPLDAAEDTYLRGAGYKQTGRETRDLWIGRGPLWAFRNTLDMLTIGRGKSSNAKALKIGIQENPNWHGLTQEQRDIAMLNAATERNTASGASQIFGRRMRALEQFAEMVSHEMSGMLHAGAEAMPAPLKAIGVAPFNETAARILRRNEIENLHTARLMVGFEFLSAPLLDGILTPYRQYYDLAQRPSLQQKLLAGENLADLGMIEKLQLDHSESALSWRFGSGVETGLMDNVQAATQHIANQWANEPAYGLLARQQAHSVGPLTEGRFNTLWKTLGRTVESDPALSATQNAARSVRLAYEMVSKSTTNTRGYLRGLLEGEKTNWIGNGIFPSERNNQIIDWDWSTAADYILTTTKEDDVAHMLRAIFASDDLVGQREMISLLSFRDLDPKLFDTNSAVVARRAIASGTSEFASLDGRQRLHSLVRTDGVDPVFRRMQKPTTEAELRLFHPDTTASEALNLAYMFEYGSTPAGEAMFDSLKEFLTFYLGSENSALMFIQSINPANSPHGSVLPAQWLSGYLTEAPGALAQAPSLTDSPQSVYQSVQIFLANTSQASVNDINVPLLAGSHQPKVAKNAGLAIQRWHKWLKGEHAIPIEGIRGALEASKQVPDNIKVWERIVSKPEYNADAAFGQVFGVNAGNRIPTSGVSAPQAIPPRVFVQGDQWMATEGMDSRWQQILDENGDGSPLWELKTDSVRDVETGEPTILGKHVINQREYVEAQIIETLRGFAMLEDQSVVQYFFSPSMTGVAQYENVYKSYYESVPSREIAPSYDLFGARIERVVDLVNEYSDGTRTWGEFEDAIWRRFGDAPITAKKGIGPSVPIDDVRDIIGTVGDGPVGQHGFRRIFTHAEDDLIPKRKLIKEPIGDINDFPGRDRLPLAPWLSDHVQTAGDVASTEKLVFGPEELKDYLQQIEGLSAEKGVSLSPVNREFKEWRQNELNRRMDSIDTVWPLYQQSRTAPKAESVIPRLTWDEFKDNPEALANLNAQVVAKKMAEAKAERLKNRIPSGFQETVNEANARGVPVDFNAKSGGEVSPAGRLVRSQLNLFPKAEMPTNLWGWDVRSGDSVTPRGIGGFNENDFPFVSTNPDTFGTGFTELASADSYQILNEWRHRNTGDIMFLTNEGAEQLLAFRGLTSRIIEPSSVKPVTSADPSVIPVRNTDALIDMGGAEIEHHKGIIDVPFDILDSEIASAPPSPIDPLYRTKRKGTPETAQFNQLDVKKTVTVLDNQYEMIVDGKQSAVAMPKRTKKTKTSSYSHRASQSSSDPFAYHSSTEVGEVHELSKTGGAGPLTGVDVGDLILIRPKASYRKKPGKVEQKLINDGKLRGEKRGKDIKGGSAPYPVRVTGIVPAATVGKKDFAELINLPVEHVAENWTSGSNYSRYRVATFERLKGTSGWQNSHLNIDNPQYPKPLTRVMGDAGTEYSYTGKNFVAQPWTPVVAEIKRRVEAITGYEFDLVIAQRYEDGNTTLGFHNDKLGNTYDPEQIVVSVNFGDTRHFEFRPQRATKEGERVGEGTGKKYGWKDTDREPGPVIELAQGDILAMMEGVNANWEHSLIGGKNTGPRINLTFRRIDSQMQRQVRFEKGPEPVPTHSSGLTRIISGGQNGADEAGLLAAQDLGIPTGGTATYRWDTTLGPKPEQGEQFGLVADAKDFPKAGSRYGSRTRQNIVNSDGTVLFSENITDTGSALTINIAQQLKKPLHHVSGTSDKATAAFIKWLEDNNIRTLNVAGNRLWTMPGKLRRKEDFQDRVQQFLVDALRGTDDVPAAAPTATVDEFGKTVDDYLQDTEDVKDFIYGMQGGGQDLTGPLDHILYVPLTHGEYIDEFEKLFPNWEGKPAIGVPGDMQAGSGAHDQAIQAWDNAFDALMSNPKSIEDLTSAAPTAAVNDLPVPEEYLGDLGGLHDYETGIIIEDATVGDLLAKADELEGEFWAKIEPGLEGDTAEYIYTGLTGGGTQSIFRQLARQGEVEVPYIVSGKFDGAGDDLWEAYVDDFLTRYPDKDPIIFLSRAIEEMPSGGYRESGAQWSHLDAIGQSVREWLDGYALRKTAMKAIDEAPAAAPTAAAADTSPVKVWAGDKSNVVLSNMAEIPGGFLFRGHRFKNPEAAYQAHKSGKGYDKSQNWTELSGWDAKKAGYRRPVDTNPESPKNSVILMREIVETRVQADPEFMKALAATGDRRIVHPSGDIWETEYPRALTNARPRAQEIMNLDQPPHMPAGPTAKEELANGEWELIGQQQMGQFDEMNAAEHASTAAYREMMALTSNESRQAAGTRAGIVAGGGEGKAIGGMSSTLPGQAGGPNKPDNHYAWLLEAGDPHNGAANAARMIAMRDDMMVPNRVSAKVPATTSKSFAKRIEGYKRSFFTGAIQPQVAAMIREPLFHYHLKEARAVLAGTRRFQHHRLDHYKELKRNLETSASQLIDKNTGEAFKGPRPILQLADDGGAPQWRLVDESSEIPNPDAPAKLGKTRSGFDDWVQYYYQNLSRMEEAALHEPEFAISRMSHLMAQYLDGKSFKIRPTEEIINDMFYIDKRRVYQFENVVNPATGEITEVPMRDVDGTHMETDVWDTGPFYQAFGPGADAGSVAGEGYEAFFWAMKQNKPEEFVRMKQQIVELLANKIGLEQRHMQISTERAVNVTAKFVDNHALRTHFQESVGTAVPFFFAQKQFLDRWARTLMHHPNSLSKLNWLLLAMQRTGIIYEDTSGESRIMIPGSEHVSEFMFETIAKFPVVRRILGDLAVLGDEYSMKMNRMTPGMDLDTIANMHVGPILSVGLNMVSTLNPELASDEWMGPLLITKLSYLAGGADPTSDEMQDAKTLLQIMFGSVVPSAVMNLTSFGNMLLQGTLFDGNSAQLNREMVSAVQLMAINDMLPDPSDMLPGTAGHLIEEDSLAAFAHLAMGLAAMKTATGFFGTTSAEPRMLKDEEDWEWNEKFQRLLDEGALSHEEAFALMYEEYYQEYIAEQKAEGVTDENVIKQGWQSELLKISVFSTGKTGKDTIASLPSTVAAFEWLDTPGNSEFLKDFTYTGGFFIPRGITEEDRVGDIQAHNRYLAIGARWRKEPEEFIQSLYVNEGALAYYKTTAEAKAEIEEYRLAKKNKKPNYISNDPRVDWSETIELKEMELTAWKDNYLAMHPIFAASLDTHESEGRREATIHEMSLLLANRDLVPETEHKESILNMMDVLVELNAQLKSLAGITDAKTARERNAIKRTFYEWVEPLIAGDERKPWLFELYFNVFVPLIGEQWIMKYDTGTLDYPKGK